MNDLTSHNEETSSNENTQDLTPFDERYIKTRWLLSTICIILGGLGVWTLLHYPMDEVMTSVRPHLVLAGTTICAIVGLLLMPQEKSSDETPPS